MVLKKNIYKLQKIAFLPLILIHIILLFNTRFTLWPEMLVYPYLLNNKFLLYKDIVNPYPPLLILFLALTTKLVGYSPLILRNLTWAFIIFLDIFLYNVARKLHQNKIYANLALAFFVFMSVPLLVNGLWFDLVQTPFIVFSIFYLKEFIEKNNLKNLQRSLIILILALFIKQQVIWLLLIYPVILLAFKKLTRTTLLALLKPSLYFFVILFIFIAYFFIKGVLPDFINWVIIFPFFKAASLPGYISLPNFKQLLVVLILFSTVLPVIFSKLKGDKILFACALVLLLFSFPRFDYFHLIPALAVVALLFPASFIKVKSQTIKYKAVYVLLLVMLCMFFINSVKRNWNQDIRFFENDIQSSATFLALVTAPQDRIYIQNGPDQLLPLAQRLPPKPWIDEFPWYLEQNNNQERVQKALSEDLKFVVYKPYESKNKYDLGTYRPNTIANYIDDNFYTYFKISNDLWLKIKN